MNITNQILITAALFIGCSTQTSELTPVLREYLTRDTASIVEQYVWDGTIQLDPQGSIDTLSWSTFGLNPDQIKQLFSSLDHQALPAIAPYVDYDSATIITSYCKLSAKERANIERYQHFASITHSIPQEHIPKDTLLPIIPRTYITGKIVGNRIVVNNTTGNLYDFQLTEDRKANLERVAQWRLNILSPTLIARGFTGCHAQMERFMANTGYFSGHMDEISKLQKKDPNALTRDEIDDLAWWDEQLNWVVHGKAKKTE